MNRLFMFLCVRMLRRSHRKRVRFQPRTVKQIVDVPSHTLRRKLSKGFLMSGIRAINRSAQVFQSRANLAANLRAGTRCFSFEHLARISFADQDLACHCQEMLSEIVKKSRRSQEGLRTLGKVLDSWESARMQPIAPRLRIWCSSGL